MLVSVTRSCRGVLEKKGARSRVSEKIRVVSCAGKGHHQCVPGAKGFACPWEIVPLSCSGHPDIVMRRVYRNVRVLFEKKKYLIGNNNNNNSRSNNNISYKVSVVGTSTGTTGICDGKLCVPMYRFLVQWT